MKCYIGIVLLEVYMKL